MEMKKSAVLGSISVEKRSGAGLPYAPVDWPNPGDVWTWKLGKRICRGFYQDRRLVLPRRLHQKGKKRTFDSKKGLITYLQSEFPETDVDAFFQSFTWKVPASFNTCEKAQVTPRPKKVNLQSKSEKIGETELKRRSWRLILSKSSSKKRIRFSPKEVKDVIDLSSWSNGMESSKSTADNSKGTTDSENIRSSASQNTGSQSSKDGPVSDQSATSQENKKISEAADKFSEDLETNIAWGKLENEYNESKGSEYIFHKELDYISLYIEMIDEQISALQSKRAELASAADVKKKEVDMLISKQKIAAESLSKVVDELEMAKKKRKQE